MKSLFSGFQRAELIVKIFHKRLFQIQITCLCHICYHLDFHNSCKFCKLYQFKLFPQTVKELHTRQIKDQSWYKSVCPHCDKKFSEPYTVKKHIELKHTSKNLKCEKCPKAFQSKHSRLSHLNPIKGGGGKNACATYFGHISSMEARIFIKFETYVHKIILDHQLNFHKYPCKDARARGENARTCDALQRFRSESTKIKKMRFSAIFE